MTSLTDQARSIAIDTDSDIMLQVRNPLNRQERQQAYRNHTAALRELLVRMQELQQHAVLLKRYFSLLAQLAGSDKPHQLGKDAEELVNAISGLGASIEKAPFDKSLAGEKAGVATPIVIGALRRKALEDELRRHGPAIEHEIELQQAALQALAVQMRSDTGISAGIREYAQVMKPYADDSTIPAEWKRNRREVLNSTPPVAAIDAATRSAAKLRENFRSLAGGRLTLADIDALTADIDTMASAVKQARSTSNISQ
jgi:hypothetical protein